MRLLSAAQVQPERPGAQEVRQAHPARPQDPAGRLRLRVPTSHVHRQDTYWITVLALKLGFNWPFSNTDFWKKWTNFREILKIWNSGLSLECSFRQRRGLQQDFVLFLFPPLLYVRDEQQRRRSLLLSRIIVDARAGTQFNRKTLGLNFDLKKRLEIPLWF